MRPLPPGYNPGRPRPGTGPLQPQQPRPGIPSQGFPVGPRQQGPIGLPRQGQISTFNSTPFPRGPMQQQAPMQQFSYGGRAGYQMGGTGIGSLPMDYGQSLQVPSMSNPSFSPMQSMPSSPMLNYGQTPLTMAGGGISRSGYQEGGMGMEMMQPQMQEQAMMQDQAMMQPQMQQESQMDLSQVDPSQIDPRRALELIIQMLIEQGIPPEQAREIAIQMVQAVAEGGMGEMSDERVEARFGGRIGYAGGGIGSLVDREGYFLGSIVKGITGAVKGVVKGVTGAVKSIVKSDIGKLALAAAAIYATGGGSFFGYTPFPGAVTPGSFSFGNIGGQIFGTPGTLMPGDVISGGTKGFLGNLGLTSGYGTDLISGGIKSLLPSMDTLKTFGLGTALGGFLGGEPKPEDFPNDEEYQKAVAKYREQYEQALNNPNPKFGPGQYPNNPFYPQRAANGGRIGYQEGGITDLVKQVTQQEFFGTPMMANGGRMGYGFGGIGNLVSNIFQKLKDKTSTPVAPTPISGPTMSERLNDLLSGGNKRFFQDRGNFSNYSLADLSNIREENDNYVYAANGGRMGYALGAEVPTRENQAGVTELDYREKGGFVPPIGIKEKADDIPAMLSNNEFVFTADAVRNAGNGSVNKGAERMYGLMKKLEAGGIV